MTKVETFRKNINILSDVDDEVHRWLSTSGPDPNIRAEKNLYVVQPDGKPYAYYSSDPSISSEIRNINSMDLASGTLTCLIGMGLGYTAKAILETMEKGHSLIVVEPNPAIMNVALERFDFSHALLSKELFILPPHKSAIQDRLYLLIGGGFVHKDIHLVPDPRSISLFPDYQKWMEIVQQAFKQATLIISGETGAAKLFVLNEFENLIQVALSPGLEKLKCVVSGRPILIAGGGPSLDHSIEWIKRLREKMVLIAFSASFRILLFHGITPHFVVAGDKNIESVAMIKNTTHAHDCPLICSARVHPEFLKAYTGARFIVPDAGPVGAWLSSCLDNVVCLETGLNVASFALHVADYLEGDPIILTGMDLAVGEYSHVTGHPHRSEVGDDPTAIRVEGVRGSMVKTFPSWCVIREGIEEQIRTMSSMVINATVSGAKIQHTKEATLKELNQTYSKMKPFAGYDTSLSPVLYKDHTQPLSEELTTFLKEADKCLIQCKNGLEASERYERSFDKSEQYKEQLRRIINQHTSIVEQLMVRYPFLNLYMGDTLLRTKVANARIARESDEKARFKIEVEKNRYALTTFEKDIGTLMDVIGTSVRNLKDFQGMLDDNRVGRKDAAALNLASFLFQNHLYQAATCEAKRALAIRADFPEAKLLLAKICIRKRRFAEAKRWIEKSLAGQGRSGESSKGKALRSDVEKKVQELRKEKEEAIHRTDRIDERLLSKELNL